MATGRKWNWMFGVGHGLVAADEAAGLKMVGGGSAFFVEQPVKANRGFVVPFQGRGHGYGLFAPILNVNFQMVLEVFAHTGQVLDHGNIQILEQTCICNTGKLKQLGGVDGAAAADDMTAVCGFAAIFPPGKGHPFGAFSAEQNPGGHGPGDQFKVFAVLDRVIVGPGRTPALALFDVPVKGGKTLLAKSVDIVGQGISRFLNRFEKRLEQRIGARADLQIQRPLFAVVFVRVGHSVFQAFEIGQTMGIVPLLHALVFGPPLVIHGIAPDIDHAVDGA